MVLFMPGEAPPSAEERMPTLDRKLDTSVAAVTHLPAQLQSQAMAGLPATSVAIPFPKLNGHHAVQPEALQGIHPKSDIIYVAERLAVMEDRLALLPFTMQEKNEAALEDFKEQMEKQHFMFEAAFDFLKSQQKYEAALEQLQQEVAELRREQQTQVEAHVELRREQKDMAATMHALKQQLDKQASSLIKAEAQATDLEGMTITVSALKQQLDEQATLLAKAQARVMALEDGAATVPAVKQQLDKQATSLTKVEAQLKSLEETSLAKVEPRFKALEGTAAIVAALKQQLCKQESSTSKVEVRVAELELCPAIRSRLAAHGPGNSDRYLWLIPKASASTPDYRSPVFTAKGLEWYLSMGGPTRGVVFLYQHDHDRRAPFRMTLYNVDPSKDKVKTTFDPLPWPSDSRGWGFVGMVPLDSIDTSGFVFDGTVRIAVELIGEPF